MGWLSREKKTKTDESSGEAVPPPPPAPSPAVSQGDSSPSPMGRYGPLVSVTSFDQAPVELTWQLPVSGELYRLMPGPDRPDYSIMVLDRPVHFYPGQGFDMGRVPGDRQVPDRKGRPMVRVDALVVCARYVGQQLHQGMRDLTINIAYVIDDRVLTDESLDLATIEFAAIGLMSEGRAVPEPAPQRVPEPRPQPQGASGAVEHQPAMGAERDRILGAAAAILREGVEARRGARVEHLTATLTLDDVGRVVELTGIADGTAPEPTPDTFGRLNAVLTGLPSLHDEPIEALSVTVAGETVSWQTRQRT